MPFSARELPVAVRLAVNEIARCPWIRLSNAYVPVLARLQYGCSMLSVGCATVVHLGGLRSETI